ncbi:MAG: RnfABCDGE type electron transport complex subunit D [bacterium]
MLKAIDNFLNKITMYRLVLYFLTALVIIAAVLGAFGLLAIDPLMLLASLGLSLLVCDLANALFAKVFNAQTNVESLYITAFILALIVKPPTSFADAHYLIFIAWAALWAMASKYIFAIGKKHIFNPAAFAVALTALTIGQSATWWVGTAWMLPFVLVGGLLVVRKLRRFDLVLSFVAASLLFTVVAHASSLSEIPGIIEHALVTSPLLFFAFVMLTEPLTTPPTKDLRSVYGVFTAVLFDPMVHIGSVYSTPELALLAGNVFSYIVSPKQKLLLTLKEKRNVAENTFDFGFSSDKKLPFRAGQYLELTLAHEKPDTRGNRRYFTIASAPTDEDIYFGIKFYPEPSTFKQKLTSMAVGDTLMAGQLAGDFTMPDDTKKKLCFIAGGIGVTPFRSMIGYLLAKQEKRGITMFYSANTEKDIAYKDVFDKAHNELGINIIYALAGKDVSKSWQGERGFVSADMMKKYMPDWRERTYYVSGPPSMVDALKKTLSQMGIPRSQIKTDFFPGYA